MRVTVALKRVNVARGASIRLTIIAEGENNPAVVLISRHQISNGTVPRCPVMTSTTGITDNAAEAR